MVKEINVGSNTCQPRPACLDAVPTCQIAEPPGGWCPKPLPSGQVCAQVITYACTNSYPPHCQDFPTPCDVPAGWITEGRGGAGTIGPAKTVTLSGTPVPLKTCDSDADCPSDYFCRLNDCSPEDCQTHICIPKPLSNPSDYPMPSPLPNSDYFIKNWVEKNFDNTAGTISLVGGVPNPGFGTNKDNPSALMAEIVFTTKKEGSAAITFGDDSAIYSNLNNINILTIKRDATISIGQSTPTPAPNSVFETGLEAGEQHDASRVVLVAESGVKWVRLNFVGSDWSANSSDVNTYNNIINEYLKHNISIIGVIGAQSVNGGYNRNDPAVFIQKFVDASDAIIARFGDRVKTYELFNEPNDWAGASNGPAQVSPEYFAQFLGRIYRQTKIVEGRKDINLNSGPLLSHDLDNGASYLSETYAKGKQLSDSLANWEQIKKETNSYPLDGIGYHVYVAQGMNDVSQVETKIKGNLDAITSVINQFDPGKKLWITEFGWGTGPGRVTEDVQAANLKKAFGIFQNYPAVRMAMWFTLLDFNTEQWGLIRGNGVKKKAWNTLEQVTGVGPLREVGYNVRGLVHYGYGKEDIFPDTDPADIDATLAEVQRIGGSVIRVFVPNKKISDDEAAKRLDSLLTKAAKYNISVIPVLINFYGDTPFYPQGMEGSYADNWNSIPLLGYRFFNSGYKDHYMSFVRTVVSYNKNHPNIYAWEPGNELKYDKDPAVFISFMRDITDTIKSLDSSHKIATGMIGASHTGLTPDELYPNLPSVDTITIHDYDGGHGNVADADWAVGNGKTAILEEMGFKGTYDRSQAMQTELNFWKPKGVSVVLPWAYIQRKYWNNGDGDGVVGMDTIWHKDYDKIASELGNFASKTIPVSSTPPVNGCSGNPCTDCIINNKGGQQFLDFYKSSSWIIACSNHNKVIDDFCTIADPPGCQSLKNTTCASACTAPSAPPSSQPTPISTPTPVPTPTPPPQQNIIRTITEFFERAIGNPSLTPSPAPVPVSTPVSILVSAPTNIPGDLNNNGRISLEDMSILLSRWGTVNAGKADINGDGMVNSVDYSLMIKLLINSGVLDPSRIAF